MKIASTFAISMITVISWLSALPIAVGATSEWHDLGGGSGRLVAVVDPQTNALRAALEVKLKPGWSTYWRYPGSTGIPPIFDFSASKGISVGTVSYPAPQLLETDGVRYAGYKKTALFYLEGQVENLSDASVSLDLLIGVCEEICIPARARMLIKTADLLRSDPEAARVLTAASIGIPKAVEPENLGVKTRMVDAQTMEIQLNWEPPARHPHLFVEGPTDWYLTPAKNVELSGSKQTYFLDVSQAPEGTDVLSVPLRYTLTSGRSAVEFEY